MDGAALAVVWASVSGGVGAHSVLPPAPPSSAVLAEAAAGKVGRVALDEAGVAAWGVLPVSQPLLWLTLTDDHLSDSVDALAETALEGRWSSPKLLYQRIDLPWPFADRHWVLRLANNTPLARASGVWERSWSVDEGSLSGARARTDAELFDSSTAVAVNRGAWLLVPVDGAHTLAVYQAWTDLGGNIPAEAAESWARSSLTGLYAGLTKHSRVVRARYGSGCEGQLGGDGVQIPCF